MIPENLRQVVMAVEAHSLGCAMHFVHVPLERVYARKRNCKYYADTGVQTYSSSTTSKPDGLVN